MRIDPTFPEKQTLLDAAYITLKYNLGLSPYQFNLILELIATAPFQPAVPSPDDVANMEVRLRQTLGERAKPRQ